MTDAGALRDIYRDLSALDERPEGIRYSAALSDGTPVMVVSIAPHLSARVHSAERFEESLARAAQVRHECVASLLEWGVASDGQLHCAYSRSGGVPLVPGALSPSDVAMLGVQMARALSAIHDAGLVHGAILTDALMLTTEHGPRLGRLGLFRALCDGGLGVQAAALGLSEPAFVAPEVQMGKIPDEQADIFSLGASLYDLLTGKPPYGGRTTSLVMASVLGDQFDATEKTNDAIAGPVIEALLRAIERAPEDRWPTADAFAQALSLSAATGEVAPAPKREHWLTAIFRSWFPARRSRG